jgi:hypothetical protein
MNTSGVNAPEKGCVADPPGSYRCRDIERANANSTPLAIRAQQVPRQPGRS